MALFLPFAWLAVDVALLVVGANRLLRLARFTVRDLPAVLLAHGLVAVALFASWALVLGYTGLLLPAVLTPALGLTATVLAWLANRRPRAANRRRTAWLDRWHALDGGTRVAAVVLGVVFILLAGLAAASTSQVPDDLSYRLPRIGIWLQTGSLATIGADDPRLDCLPFLADLLQWWVTARSETGFPLVALVGCAGGGIAILAVFASARLLRVPPYLAALAALLALLCPAAFAQFFTAQTDLPTTGMFAAGGYFALRAWRTDRPSLLAGLGFGLAFAMKTTPIYLAPAAVVVVLVALVARRVTPRFVLQQALIAGGCFLVFAGPKHVQNCFTFGNPLGPRDLISRHTPGQGLGHSTEIFRRNVLVWSAHNFDPNANPPFVHDALARITPGLLDHWVTRDTDTGMTLVANRRAALQTVFAAPGPEADTPSFGLGLGLAAILATGGACFRLRNRRSSVWVGSALLVAGWFVTMAALAWHPYGYRYSVLVLPALALAIAAAAARAGIFGRVVLGLLVVCQLSWAGWAIASGYQYGPRAGTDARGAGLIDYLALQRRVVEGLPAHVRNIDLVATDTAITAGFFRTTRECEIRFARSADVRAAGTFEAFGAARRVDAVICTAGSGLDNLPPGNWERREVRVGNVPALSFSVALRQAEAKPETSTAP